MLRFFLDENFPLSAQSALSNYKVETALEVFSQGEPDYKLLAYAQEVGAVFLTTDKDFYHTLPWKINELNCPIIVIALAQPNASSLIQRLVEVIELLSERLSEPIVVLVKDRKIYVREWNDT